MRKLKIDMLDKNRYIQSIHRIFLENLKVKKNEYILIFTDNNLPKTALLPSDIKRKKELYEIARIIASEGKNFTNIIFHNYPSTGSHGAEPPVSLWKLAFDKKIIDELSKKKVLNSLIQKTASDKEILLAHKIVSANRKHRKIDGVIALSWFSTTHTRFRKLLTESYKVRYASMPLFEPDMLLGPINVDLEKMEKRTILLAEYLSNTIRASITSPNGTNLSFKLEGRYGVADTGVLMNDGTVSNLPAGEAYIAPLEGTAKGKLVVNYAPSRKLKKPLIFYVEKGEIKRLKGDKVKKDQLNRIFKRFPKAQVLAELGLGTNDKVCRPDNILESEKILGTAHIAFGDNSTFGGKNCVPFHEDFVIFQPTVKLYLPDKKEKLIIKNGKLLI